MKKILFLGLFTLLLSVNAFAHQAFTLVSSEKKTLKEAELAGLEKNQTIGKKEKTNLTFTETEIRLIAITGPEDDMLSYRIQGVRNPNLIVPSGATLKILFVNIDGDMKHDIRFGHIEGEFTVAPDVTGTAGSERLTAKSDDGTLQAEELVIQAKEGGAYKYFCSVRGHAKGGMWGNILVGVKPGENLKTAPKTKHVHTADEDKPTDEKMPDDKMKDMDMGDKKGMEDKKDMSNMPGMKPDEMMMRSTINIAEPMTRESSGTAWAPESSPMYAKMKMLENGDMFMFHFNGFARYTRVGSDRDLSVGGKGDNERFDAPTMFMGMYSHPLSERAQIGLRLMMSLDPIIERGYGYPLLYQSGESYRGRPMHDRQHPHDLFSELSASFSYKFNDKQSFFLYVGMPGEPALGPPTFMHRISAMDNPDAPLSHHWQDSTHITFGVVTAGYVYNKVKFEVSAFKGQEPDENRWNFDSPKLDSFSGRLSWNPTQNWSFQISHGYLKNPEPAEPNVRIRRRTTASAIYNRNFADDRNWSNAFIWGQNRDDEGSTNSFLYETNYQFQKNTIYGRFERVQKSVHELDVENFFVNDNQNFWIGLLSFGYIRDLVKDKGVDVGLGAQATWYNNPSKLTPVYGETNHGGFQIFMRFRPSKTKEH